MPSGLRTYIRDLINSVSGRFSPLPRVRIFVSHSSKDGGLAIALSDLLCAALDLTQREVRCTSADEYGLPTGADTNEQIREEVQSADAVVGLLSADGMSSAYVLFELGARWGAKRWIAPILAHGFEFDMLRGPISQLNAKRCDTASSVVALLNDTAEKLGLEVAAPEKYADELNAVTTFARNAAVSPIQQSATTPILTIDAPSAGERVDRHHEVRGTVEPAGTPVQVLIFARDNLWYPQPAVNSSDGRWRAACTIGSVGVKSGSPYRLVAASGERVARPVRDLPSGLAMSMPVDIVRR